MKGSTKNARTISILATVVITIVAWAFCRNFTTWISTYLTSIFKPMSSWALAYPVFALSIGLIPFTSFLVWKRNRKADYKSLISYWIIGWCMLFLFSVLAFVLVDILVKPESPFLPEYIVWLPFPDYWNLVLPLASISGPVLLLLINKRIHPSDSTAHTDLIDHKP